MAEKMVVPKAVPLVGAWAVRWAVLLVARMVCRKADLKVVQRAAWLVDQMAA